MSRLFCVGNRSTTDGEKQWSYTILYYSQANSSSYIPVVGFIIGEENTQTKSLVITFKNEKVSSYSFCAGANNVKTAIFNSNSIRYSTPASGIEKPI
jgi:hypothetical protein